MKKKRIKRNSTTRRQHVGLQVAGGVTDVFRVALASLAIVLMIALIGSLYSWLRQDLNMTFADLGTNLSGAVMVDPEKKGR